MRPQVAVPVQQLQDAVGQLYRQPKAWDRKALLNVARSGRFSSDRTIAEYADDVWQL